MSETIVKSFNIFLDSDMHHDITSSKGDAYEVHLNSVNLDTSKGQNFRLTLTNFSMYKNFTNINQHNNRFVLRTTSNHDKHLNLTMKNYENINDIANEFAKQVKDAFVDLGKAGATVGWQIKPAASGSSDNIISFEIEFGQNHGYNSGDVKILFYEEYPDGVTSDIFALLGGDRIKAKAPSNHSFDTSPSSIDVSFGDPQILKFTCRYPAQKYTEQFVYLRHNLPSNNLESTSLDDRQVGSQTKACDVHHSNILARFPIHNEFIHWDTQSEKEYYIDLPTNQNHLNYLKLSLTNKGGRNIGFSENQSTLGNLNFTVVLKCDIIQKFNPNERFTKDPVRTVPSRFSNPQIDFDGHKR